jgi:hypothetical protein
LLFLASRIRVGFSAGLSPIGFLGNLLPQCLNDLIDVTDGIHFGFCRWVAKLIIYLVFFVRVSGYEQMLAAFRRLLRGGIRVGRDQRGHIVHEALHIDV